MSDEQLELTLKETAENYFRLRSRPRRNDWTLPANCAASPVDRPNQDRSSGSESPAGVPVKDRSSVTSPQRLHPEHAENQNGGRFKPRATGCRQD